MEDSAQMKPPKPSIAQNKLQTNPRFSPVAILTQYAWQTTEIWAGVSIEMYKLL